MQKKNYKDIIKGIVANKIDLFLNEQVSQEVGEEYAKSIGALFLTTSAKTGSPKEFKDFLIKLYEKYLSKSEANESDEQNDTKSIVLEKKKKKEDSNKEKNCC